MHYIRQIIACKFPGAPEEEEDETTGERSRKRDKCLADAITV